MSQLRYHSLLVSLRINYLSSTSFLRILLIFAGFAEDVPKNREICASQPASVSMNSPSARTVHSDGGMLPDLRMLSVEGHFKKISERVSDPVTHQVSIILSEEISEEFSDHSTKFQ